MKRLFGTDGVRGRAAEYPLDDPTVRRLGAALGEVLGSGSSKGVRVLIGRDTRESGPALESCLAAGLADAGAAPEFVGIVSTPALAYLTRADGYSAGAMISASHNPFRDNGIKLFGPDGMKFPDAREAALEEIVLDRPPARPTLQNGADLPSLAPRPNDLLADPVEERIRPYIDHLLESAGFTSAQNGRTLDGLSVVLDCAHGSAYRIAPRVFEALGARVTSLGCRPTGTNINEGAGSLHLDVLCSAVEQAGADLGLAFDGDADRCLAVDRDGRPLDGDFILYVQARRLRRQGRLRGDVVVATVMSNLWLEKALEKEGIRLLRAPVGDKYVLERMIEEGAALGGEQSGHVIFPDHFPTGDGVLTGLQMACAMATDGEDLASLAAGIRRYPQVLENVRVSSKPEMTGHPVLGPAIRGAEEALAGSGRVLVRYSGTEALARVMVEGADEDAVSCTARDLADLIRREIGS